MLAIVIVSSGDNCYSLVYCLLHFLKVILVSMISGYFLANVLCMRTTATVSVTAGVRSRVEGERPYSRGWCFCTPSSKVKGKVRTNQDVLLCLEPKGSGLDKWQTPGALTPHHC